MFVLKKSEAMMQNGRHKDRRGKKGRNQKWITADPCAIGN